MFTVYTCKEISEMSIAEGKLVSVLGTIYKVQRLMCKSEGDKEIQRRAELPRYSKEISEYYIIENNNGTYWLCKRDYLGKPNDT